ncbi:MAG: TetR/AcrR family transcriptional regulator, partial [Deltaproteobacteria bacterium]|nr:TetR/AcrR family transcriptional regulator [Deltaproteobacteria bacterium]
MPKQHTAKEKLLEAAQTLMLSKGYPATTVDEICELAHVSKGSFYHAFDTKEALGLAVLEAFGERNARLIAEGPQAHIDDPVDRALQLLDHLMETAGEMWGSGCLLGSFALDLADTHPAIGEAVSDAFRGIADGLAEGMAPLAAEGGHAGALSAGELAEHFIVVVEGALILAKAHQDWSYVTRALERFQREVHATVAVGA